MFLYTCRRLLQLFPTVLVTGILSFALINFAPGDPVYVFVGGVGANSEYIEMMEERLGLDQPLTVRLMNYLGNLVRGDFGRSLFYGEGVFDIILKRVPNTLILVVPTLLFSGVIGILLGSLSAIQVKPWKDSALMSIAIVGYSIPLFWMGQLLLAAFAMKLKWLPLSGMYDFTIEHSTFWGLVLDYMRHAVLPVACGSIYQIALISRITRMSMVETMQSDYVRVAKAKGLRAFSVWYKYVFRNGIFPIITVLGLNAAFIFAGTVVIEFVFSWPGLGLLTYRAVLSRDYALLTGVLMFAAAGAVLANLGIDLAYALLDPRVTYD